MPYVLLGPNLRKISRFFYLFLVQPSKNSLIALHNIRVRVSFIRQIASINIYIDK